MASVVRLAAGLPLLFLAGCYAPLCSPGIPASSLPDSFRVPVKACSAEVNYAMLTRPVAPAHILGPDDLVRVEIGDLSPRVRRLPRLDGAAEPPAERPYSSVFETYVDERGTILLPLVGAIRIADMTLPKAQAKMTEAYAEGILDDPRVSITLIQSRTTRVMVMGNVLRPDVYELPRFESDVAHALTLAGGVLPERADEIQVHRRDRARPTPSGFPTLAAPDQQDCFPEAVSVLRIPLRSFPPVMITPEQATLNDGDVVVVREAPDEIFFVVGKLSPNNFVRFTLGRDDRDLGNGFILPKDRDVDVVTAVAMAGYIDPIDSPTTVTVHRTMPDGNPMLIHVDLIAARGNRKENILVQARDIIYLNPDGAWYFRRTLDRILPELLTAPYAETMERLINPGRLN